MALVALLGGAPLAQAQAEVPAVELAAQPGETVLVERLAGIVFRATPDTVVPAGVTHDGYDVSAVPLLQGADFAAVPAAFLGRPLSFESSQRLALSTRLYLQQLGYPFFSVFVPPQAIEGATLQVVVAAARFPEIVRVEGARHFRATYYLRALRQPPGQPLHVSSLAEDIDWLNRHPYHRVTAVVEPGEESGGSALVLKVQESDPLRWTLGYDNTGTDVTDEDRLSAGVDWGNAFGRGDALSYRLRVDPRWRHSLTHSASYAAALPWRHHLHLSGAWSRIESRLPSPFTQEGRSYQVGLRYALGARQLGGGWSGQWDFSADYKVTDNTLEFAAIPVTDNVTHVAQVGLGWALSRRDARQTAEIAFSLHASPGGLTDRNTDAAFEGTRFGARARYLYGRLEGRYARRLSAGFHLNLATSAQLANRELLGSEQLAGSGSSAVRGYAESSAFGDDGALVRTELHFPAFALLKHRDQAGAFVFFDAAILGTRGLGGATTRLASSGIGVNYDVGRHLSLRAAWGWQLKDLPHAAGRTSHGHFGAGIAF